MNNIQENEFGVTDKMLYGITNVKAKLADAHPLEKQEKNYKKLEEEMAMNKLRLTQGLHASFKLKHELDAARKIGRLAGLKSSNLMVSALNGTDETLEVEDIINNQKDFCEHNTDSHLAWAPRY